MEWFSGSIPEAINLSKSQNSVFVVFITDESEASAATEACLSRAGSNLRQSSVAIKLASNSETAQMFNQIYPILVLPSLYFINPNNGVPVEILAGAVTDENLTAKIPTILKECTSQSISQAPTEPLEQTSANAASKPSASGDFNPGTITDSESSAADPSPREVVSGNESTEQIPEPSASVPVSNSSGSSPNASAVAEGSIAEPPASTSNVSPASADENNEKEGTGVKADTSGESSVPLEDRVARARKLAEQKKQQREREQFQKEHEEEIKRRQMGKSIHQMKQEQEQKELRELAAERKRDKEMDRLARERVKAQIAADRAEREERNALLRGNLPASPAPPPSVRAPESSSTATSCRLKLRLPDGSSELARFEPSVMLSEVRQHVQQNVKLPFTRFKLVSSVHQRPFTDQDMNTSLADLGLAPSAIVLVMPSNIGSGQNGDGNGRGGVVSVSTSWLESLMWLIMLPVNAVMGLVSSFFGGGNRGARPQSSASESPGAASATPAAEPGASSSRRTSERPKTAYGTRSQARYRKEGNIHRLGNDDDDDDENNTWNGNSTQQM